MAPITFVSLLFLLCQVFCAYFGYHTHIVHCVNLERCVQKTTVTQGIESQRKLSKTKKAEAKIKQDKSEARSPTPSLLQMERQLPPGNPRNTAAALPFLLIAKGAQQVTANRVSTGLLLLLNLPPVTCGALLTTDWEVRDTDTRKRLLPARGSGVFSAV